MNEENLYLIYVEKVGKNVYDMFEYDFIFSETPDVVWADDWAEQCPSACDNLRPDNSMISEIKRLATIIPLKTASENSCFSMQDCVDGILSLAWEDISEYEEYPDPIRLNFSFGEKFSSVEDKLARRSQFFSTKKSSDEESSSEEREDFTDFP